MCYFCGKFFNICQESTTVVSKYLLISQLTIQLSVLFFVLINPKIIFLVFGYDIKSTRLVSGNANVSQLHFSNYLHSLI